MNSRVTSLEKPSLAEFSAKCFQVKVPPSLDLFLENKVHKKTKLPKYVYTVVKRGHTEGIEREKTSSQKYTVFSL